MASNINVKISSFLVFLTAIAAPVGNAAFGQPPPALLDDDFFGLGSLSHSHRPVLMEDDFFFGIKALRCSLLGLVKRFHLLFCGMSLS